MKLRSIAFFLSGSLGLLLGLGLIYYPQRVQQKLYQSVATVFLLHHLQPIETQLKGRELTVHFKIPNANAQAEKIRIQKIVQSIPGLEKTIFHWTIEAPETPVTSSPMPAPKEDSVAARRSALQRVRELAFHFDYKRTEMQWSAQGQFVELVTLLKSYPSVRIEILGYADDIGPSDYNIGLSAKRADFVKSLLIEAGIAANRIIAKGLGENKSALNNSVPSASYSEDTNETESVRNTPIRKKMRRVEFRLFDSDGDLETSLLEDSNQKPSESEVST